MSIEIEVVHLCDAIQSCFKKAKTEWGAPKIVSFSNLFKFIVCYFIPFSNDWFLKIKKYTLLGLIYTREKTRDFLKRDFL